VCDKVSAHPGTWQGAPAERNRGSSYATRSVFLALLTGSVYFNWIISSFK
jgi:hypothetical protein